MVSEIHVESTAGLDYSLPDIWKLRPVLCVGTDAYSVLPLKASAGALVKFIDKDGKSIELRLQKVEKLPAHNNS